MKKITDLFDRYEKYKNDIESDHLSRMMLLNFYKESFEKEECQKRLIKEKFDELRPIFELVINKFNKFEIREISKVYIHDNQRFIIEFREFDSDNTASGVTHFYNFSPNKNLDFDVYYFKEMPNSERFGGTEIVESYDKVFSNKEELITFLCQICEDILSKNLKRVLTSKEYFYDVLKTGEQKSTKKYKEIISNQESFNRRFKDLL